MKLHNLSDRWDAKERGDAPYAPITTQTASLYSAYLKHIQEQKANLTAMQKQIDSVASAVQDIKAALDVPNNNGLDNYSMSPEQAKALIVANYPLGVPVYPSDIAIDNGLEYKTVLAAIDPTAEGRPDKMKDDGPFTLYGEGDSIVGTKVLCEYRSIRQSPKPITKTNSHRGGRATLEGGVTCIIDKAITMQRPPENRKKD